MELAPITATETPNPAISKTKPKKRRIQIDVFTGFRGIAALWVFIFHRAVKSETEIDQMHLQWVAVTGQSGVGLFFCLSGFIMVWVYGNCKFTSYRCYFSFIGRRIARLLPLYYFSMALSIYDARCMWSSDSPCSGLDWFAIAITIIPIRSWTVFNISNVLWNPPLWSVQTEFFFYMVFPFLLRLARYILDTDSLTSLAENQYRKRAMKRIGMMFLIATFLSAIPIIVRFATPDNPNMSIFFRGQTVAYYTPYARVPEFFLGMLTAIVFIIYTTKDSNEQSDENPTTALIAKDETRQRNKTTSWFQQFRANYKLHYIYLEIYFALQIAFFFLIHSPALGRTKHFTKYDEILIYGPAIGLLMCSNLYLYAKFPWTIVSQILVTTAFINMGDISYAFYCLVEALPKLSVVALGVVETSATMRFWSGIGIAAFAHYYLEIIIYNWANKKLPKCTC